jgi:hypothetical protein
VGGMALAWREHWEHIAEAKFSLIAAQLLHDEIDNVTCRKDARDFKRRHNRHIRAGMRHLRKAKRIRAKIRRYEGKLK